MKKRTYKQMKNRLYREIKARKIAEAKLQRPIKIETLRVKRSYAVPANYEERMDAFNKQQLARELVTRLLEDEYIAFRTKAVEYGQCLMVEAEAELNVMKPLHREEWT